MKRAGMDPLQNLRGSGQGVIQGAIETGADLRETTASAIQASREIAHQIGLTEDVAAATTVEGMLEAAKAAGPEALAIVKKSLPEELQKADTKQEQE